MVLKYIRKRLVYAIRGNKVKQRAIAFYFYSRDCLKGQGCVPEFSVYKMRKILRRTTTVRKMVHTQVPGAKRGTYKKHWASVKKVVCPSDTTIKKYIAILEEMGLVYFDVRKDGKRTLRFRKIASSTERRNLSVDGLCFKTFDEAYVSVSTLEPKLTQRKKDFTKRVIRINNEPHCEPSNYRKENHSLARKYCNQYAKSNADGSFEYHEFGMSYEYIANTMGVCPRTAFRIIEHAVMRRYIKKQNHFTWFRLPEYCDEMPRATFIAKGWGCIVEANTYELSDRCKKEWENNDSLYEYMSLGEIEQYHKVQEEKHAKFKSIWEHRQSAASSSLPL